MQTKPALTLRWTPRAVLFESRDPTLVTALEALLTIRNPRFEAERRYDEDAVEYFQLIDRQAGFFMPGVLGAVEAWLKESHILYDLLDTPPARPYTEVSPTIIPGVTLRPYQVAAVEACLAARRGVVELATGAGKTEVALGLILAKGVPDSIITVPDTTAQRELYKRLLRYGFGDITGRYGGDYDETSKPITIAVMPSLYAGVKKSAKAVMDLLSRAKVFVCDEAHHGASADSWQVVLGVTSAEDRIALSGTALNDNTSRSRRIPEDPYDAMLLGLFGTTLMSVGLADLIDMGYAARLRVTTYPAGTNEKLPAMWNWAKVYSVAVENAGARSERIALLAANQADMGYRPLVSIERLRQGRIIQDYAHRYFGQVAICAFGDDVFVVPRKARGLFRGFEFRDIPRISEKPLPIEYENDGRRRIEADYVSPVLDADSGGVDEFDKQLRALFEAGKVHVLVGSRVYNEVVSLSFLTDLINAAGYKANKQVRQRWGRPARPHPGKNLAVAWEPDDDAHFYLKHHVKKRLDIAEGERLDVHPVVPVECWFRLRDLARVVVSVRRRESDMRIKEVEVSASMQIPVQARSGATISIAPRVTFIAEMEATEDEREVIEKLGIRATAGMLREAERQAAWASEAATQGPTGAVQTFAASVAKPA